MAKQPPKPTGYEAFESALRTIAGVPREKVDARVAAAKKARIKQRRKKK